MVEGRHALHPGTLLREAVLPSFKAQKITAGAFARELGMSRSTLYRILDAELPITPEVALRLERLVPGGVSAERWMAQQAGYDLAAARAGLSAQLEQLQVLGDAQAPLARAA